MSERATPAISPRKQPRQARSTELVAVLLQAAAQVLAREGAARFTTARVAERAGVSVGSVYQYFPNKAAILFRLQADEWRQTSDLLGNILRDATRPAPQRLRELVHAFIRSECEEAAMRTALGDAAPLYRQAPEARQARAAGEAAFAGFLAEWLPAAEPSARALACELLLTTLSATGKAFSEQPRSEREIVDWADAMAAMFRAHLEGLPARRVSRAGHDTA